MAPLGEIVFVLQNKVHDFVRRQSYDSEICALHQVRAVHGNDFVHTFHSDGHFQRRFVGIHTDHVVCGVFFYRFAEGTADQSHTHY